METVVFIISAVIVLTGAVGVIIAKNPVHSALMLVMTLFGVAVLFILLEAEFLAAIQVIVYAGAIVILFLFVIMLLGVDRSVGLGIEPIMGQRPLAAVASAAMTAMVIVAVLIGTDTLTGVGNTDATFAIDPATDTTQQLGEHLFTDYVVAFQLTAVLLTVAVVGAVALSRRIRPSADAATEEVEA